MKIFILLAAAVVLVASEAPIRYTPQRFQRLEQAPYQPAGYRPTGQEFRLPERQQVPQSVYGPPQEYGPPAVTTTGFPEDITTTETPTTTYSPAPEQIKNEEKKNEKISEEEFTEQEVYYIYHPSGLLQRVVYATRKEVEDMGYTAQLTYKDVEPIQEPIYTYDPETLVFSQIKK